jgi:hypothetical protein
MTSNPMYVSENSSAPTPAEHISSLSRQVVNAHINNSSSSTNFYHNPSSVPQVLKQYSNLVFSDNKSVSGQTESTVHPTQHTSTSSNNNLSILSTIQNGITLKEIEVVGIQGLSNHISNSATDKTEKRDIDPATQSIKTVIRSVVQKPHIQGDLMIPLDPNTDKFVLKVADFENNIRLRTEKETNKSFKQRQSNNKILFNKKRRNNDTSSTIKHTYGQAKLFTLNHTIKRAYKIVIRNFPIIETKVVTKKVIYYIIIYSQPKQNRIYNTPQPETTNQTSKDTVQPKSGETEYRVVYTNNKYIIDYYNDSLHKLPKPNESTSQLHLEILASSAPSPKRMQDRLPTPVSQIRHAPPSQHVPTRNNSSHLLGKTNSSRSVSSSPPANQPSNALKSAINNPMYILSSSDADPPTLSVESNSHSLNRSQNARGSDYDYPEFTDSEEHLYGTVSETSSQVHSVNSNSASR